MAGPGADDGALRRSLEESLGRENVFMDERTRHSYATDASPCVVEPRAVVAVRSEEEVLRILAVCRDARVPLTPRASGTSLSGAAVGPGVILDTTGFHRILEFSAARGWVRVEPGILLSELNAFLREKGVRFAPDPGSQELCRIGGMIGHNASGYRTVKYAVRGTIETHRGEIFAARRPIQKHACGYDVFTVAESLERGVFPLASLFVGSEGTLGVVTQATLRVLPIPHRRLTLLVYLDRFEELGAFVGEIAALGPSAMEAVNGESLRLLPWDALGVPESAGAMLLVEFDEGDLDGIAKAVVERIAPRFRLSRGVEVADDPERQAILWKVRAMGTRTTARSSTRQTPSTSNGCGRCARSSTTRSSSGSAALRPRNTGSAGSAPRRSRGSGVPPCTTSCGESSGRSILADSSIRASSSRTSRGGRRGAASRRGARCDCTYRTFKPAASYISPGESITPSSRFHPYTARDEGLRATRPFEATGRRRPTHQRRR